MYRKNDPGYNVSNPQFAYKMRKSDDESNKFKKTIIYLKNYKIIIYGMGVAFTWNAPGELL